MYSWREALAHNYFLRYVSCNSLFLITETKTPYCFTRVLFKRNSIMRIFTSFCNIFGLQTCLLIDMNHRQNMKAYFNIPLVFDLFHLVQRILKK